MSTDSTHQEHLSKLKKLAQQGNDQFADWATRADTNPAAVYQEIQETLGNLPINKPWDVFAEIFNEDTPESVFLTSVDFADEIFIKHNIDKTELIADIATGTGSISRLLVKKGYLNIVGIDANSHMLNQARKLSKKYPITFIETAIEHIALPEKAAGIVWYDFSSNFALDTSTLTKWLTSLITNLRTGGILIFDIRTQEGWDVEFFKKKVTTYQADNFQRIWINLPNKADQTITFDVYIRTKNASGDWSDWQREQMTEKMWSFEEIKTIVQNLPGILLEGIYGDAFEKIEDNARPALPKFVLVKTS